MSKFFIHPVLLLLHHIIISPSFSFPSDTAGSFQSQTYFPLFSHLLASFQRSYLCLSSASMCPQCVPPAARSSSSRGWGRTGSSSFCWACSWLWSAGSWTTPSPSVRKVRRGEGGCWVMGLRSQVVRRFALWQTAVEGKYSISP